ncbi:MAG: thioredoxin family protein [Deltaproteobacteria bacterium]
MGEEIKIGDKAPEFKLPGVDGTDLGLSDLSDKKAVAVMFTCNHCPYVQAYEQRVIALQEEFAALGFTFVGINSNDDKNYPEDSFESMIKRAGAKGYNFPYLRDKSQQVARAFGASHTPQVFLLDSRSRLRYTGKIDDNWREPEKVKERYLRDAILALIEGRQIANPETYAIGCTIKWTR